MTASGFLLFTNLLSFMVLCAGLGAVLLPLYRAWFSSGVREQMLMFQQAADFETGFLLPGMAATGVTGVLWAVETGHNLFTEGWLVTLLVLYVVAMFAFLPLMGIGLRRVRLFALRDARTGVVSEELQQALADRVPLVFGSLIAAVLPLMAWLRVFQPY